MRRVAEYAATRRGLVLDYSTVSGYMTNLTFQGDTTYYVTGPLNLSGVTTIEGGTVVKFANANNPSCQVSGTIVCQTGFYSPAVFTARDDNSVGAIISGSTGTPSGRYAATALAIQDNTSDLRNLRIGWATNAITYAANSGWPHYLTHVQVLNCNYGVSCQSPVFWVRNGLFNNVQTVFSTSSSGVVGNCEHLTVDSANCFNGSSSGLTLNVTNSLLVGVTTPGNYSGAGNATDTSAAFQSALAGTHYLANGSLHHNAGTGNISCQLQTDFRNFTTYPPLVYLNVTNSVNSLWAPQAARDTSGTPDRGYHYPALDYLISGVIVNGGTLVLTNGVAVAGYGSYALRTSGSGVVVSEGIPEQMNRLTTYHAVQEQGHRWITNFWMLNGVNLNLRFTDATAMSGANTLVASGELGAGTLNFRDCQFHDLAWTLYKYSSTPSYINFTNNVFDRCAWSFAQGLSLCPIALPSLAATA